MNQAETEQFPWDLWQKRSLLVGIVGLLLCALGAWFSLEQFFRAYLVAYIFWVTLAWGCLSLVMLHQLIRGTWGLVTVRLFESGAGTLALLALLFIPIIFGMEDLYVWTNAEVVAQDKLLQHKASYLNIPAYLVRTVVYFVIWLLLTFFLTRWSIARDRSNDFRWTRDLRRLSAGGLVLFVLTVTFASFDWLMSLEPLWYSTAYGAIFAVGSALSALAYAIPVVLVLRDHRSLQEMITPKVLNDLGNLLLAFLMLWAYLAFSQYLIIWSGNLPDEIVWYIRRFENGWGWVIIFIVVLHFVVPFFLLLSRTIKRNPRTLTLIACGLLVMHYVNLIWTIRPAWEYTPYVYFWIDPAAFIGIGGIWIFAFVWLLKRKALLPINDPAWDFHNRQLEEGNE